MTDDKKGFGQSKPKEVRTNLRFKQSNPKEREHDATKEYPSIAQQAKNMAQSAKDVAKDPRWVDNEEYERRMTLCRACPLYDKEQNRCRKCGCMLKGKARFKAGKCPIQKW
mgnify:CR=1 FL=1